MIKLIFTKRVLRESRKLPTKLQEKLGSRFEILKEDPFHPILRTKLLSGNLSGFYSFRITREWRVIFQFLTPDIIKVLHIGHRKYVYNFKS